MSTLEIAISESLLPVLEGDTDHEKWINCTNEYPWYPLPWLMLAENDNRASIQKANLWFNDEQRLHWLLNAEPWQSDSWVKEQLEKTISNNNYHSENQDDIRVHEVVVPGNKTAIAEPPENETQESGPIDLSNSENTGVKQNTEQVEKEHNVENTEETIEDNSVSLNDVSLAALIDKIETGKNENAPHTDINASGAGPSVKPVSPEPLAFEPYHSVDYFASQGIKLDLSAEPKDKFDRQLKSFTQWLKAMKKVTVEETTAVTDPAVEAQANQSNSGKVIITEAMALVLEKQGKYEKASEIYKKLLLLHPEKSVFFAARIEELKNKQ